MAIVPLPFTQSLGLSSESERIIFDTLKDPAHDPDAPPPEALTTRAELLWWTVYHTQVYRPILFWGGLGMNVLACAHVCARLLGPLLG